MEKIKGLKREIIFKNLLSFSGYYIVLLTILTLITLIWNSYPILKTDGVIKNIFSTEWDPINNRFGMLAFAFGTIITSIIALFICIPFAISISIFLSQYFKTGKISSLITSCVELMAGIPSVIYGFWGLYVLIPLVIDLQIKIGVIPYGAGIFSASIILAIMIIPYATLLSYESLKAVPDNLKEAAYSLGATEFEVILKVIIPHAFSGIVAGIILAFGRAVGETMAVTMVIGNSSVFPESIWSMSNTLSSVIANEFIESVSELHRAALITSALVLFVITAIINITGKLIIKRYAVRGE